MNWGGVIAGALGSAGAAAVDFSKNQQAQQQKLDLLRVQADIDKEKAAYIAEMGERIRREGAHWDTDMGPQGQGTRRVAADTAREKALTGVRTDAALDLAQKQIPIAVEQEQKVGAVRAENVGREATARASAETAEMLKRFNDPNYIRGLSAVAQAQHKESAASLAQAALARLQMEGAQDLQRLQRSLADARRIQDPEARDTAVAKIQQEISDKAYTGKDTGKAYGAYIAASTKLIDLQAKIDDPTKPISDADKARLNADMAETRAVMQQAAKDLGIKTPGANAAPTVDINTLPEAQRKAAIDMLKKNPAMAGDFDAKFGKGAAAKALGQQPTTPGVSAAASTPASGPGLNITEVPAGYGTKSYMFQGRYYPTKEAAQAARDEFSKQWDDWAAGRLQ